MIDKAASYAKGLDFEIFYCQYDKVSCEIARDTIEFVSKGKTDGMGVRVAIGSKVGLSSTNDLSRYKKTIDTAKKIAKLSDDTRFKGFAAQGRYRQVKSYDKQLIGYDDYSSLVEEFSSGLQEIDEGISFSQGSYEKAFMNRRVINSNGVDVEESFCANSLDFESLAKGELTISGGINSNTIISPVQAPEFAHRLLSLKGRTHAPTSSMPVVLHKEALAQLFQPFIEEPLNAENIIESKSPFTDKLGKQLFSENVNITDDPTQDMLMGSCMADDEGTPAAKTELFEKGVLRSFLHNTYTSNVLGQDNTGNAARVMGKKPGVSTTNLLMAPGKSECKIEKGLFVRELMGTHTADTSSGNFSLGVSEGHYIENYEKKHPVKDTMVAGNFYEMMRQIEVGSKARLCYGGDGYYLPDVVCNLKVIGK